MAFHDPEIECSCDYFGCSESVYLSMNWSVGGYDLVDDRAEQMLVDDHYWMISDGSHYCHACKHKIEDE